MLEFILYGAGDFILHQSVDLDSLVRAHPCADTAGITLLCVFKFRQQVSLRREFIARLNYATAGAEFNTITTPFTIGFIYNYLASCHKAPLMHKLDGLNISQPQFSVKSGIYFRNPWILSFVCI